MVGKRKKVKRGRSPKDECMQRNAVLACIIAESVFKFLEFCSGIRCRL